MLIFFSSLFSTKASLNLHQAGLKDLGTKEIKWLLSAPKNLIQHLSAKLVLFNIISHYIMSLRGDGQASQAPTSLIPTEKFIPIWHDQSWQSSIPARNGKSNLIPCACCEDTHRRQNVKFLSACGKATKVQNLGKLNVMGFKQKRTAVSPTSKSYPSIPCY